MAEMKTANTPSKVKPLKNVPMSIKLGSEQKDLLVRLAKEKQRSVHFLLCQAVKEFIDKENTRSDFYETAKIAGEHYEQTGLHTTQEELRAWANSLGGDNELTPPTCHE